MGPLCVGVVAPEKVMSMVHIELFDIQTVYLWWTGIFEINSFYI